MLPWLLRLLLMLSVYRVVKLQTPVSLIINLRRHFLAGCVFFSTGNSTGLHTSALYFEVQRSLVQEGIFSQAIALEDTGRVECRNSPLFVLTVDDLNRFRGLGNFPGSSVLDRTVWLLLLLDDERLEEVLFGVDIPFDREFLVAEKCRSGNTVTEVYRTSGSQPLQIFHYGNWSGPWPGLNMYERRRDLHGITLRATAKRRMIPNKNSNMDNGGSIREIWNILEQRMNFTTDFIEPPDGAWGTRHANGSWSGMIGQVQRREVAVAVSTFTMTVERAAVVHFSLPVHETKILAYLREPRFDDFNWKSFLAPLSSSLWQATSVCMLVLAATLAGLYFFSWRYGDESAQGVYRFSFRDSLFYMFTSLTQQGHDVMPSSPSGRVVYLSGYLVAVLVITAYSAALVSFLTVQVKELPFRDLNGLLADGTYKLGVVTTTAELNMFSESNDSLMQQLYEKLMKPDPQNFAATLEEAASRVCRTKFVLVVSAGFAGSVLQKPNCSIASLPDVSFKDILSLALARGSPYLGLINHILLNMRNSGILRHMYEKSQILLQDSKETSLSSVRLENVVPIFTVLACGVGIALLLLAVEMTQHRLSRRLQLTSDTKGRSLFRRRPFRWNLLQKRELDTFLCTDSRGSRPLGEMRSSVPYIFLLVLLYVGIGEASMCSSDDDVFHFSISSKKNSSHYRTIQVDLNSGKARKPNDNGEITLDVEHGRSWYNNGELIRLSTSASVLETPLRRGDYELFPGLGYYKLHTTAEGWETARQMCLSEGAHLIVINSDAEANVVKEYFSRKPTFTGNTISKYIFAGFHDKYTEGDFITVTGVPLSKSGYAKWGPSQPNGKSDQNFGVVDDKGLLGDCENSYELPFVCEQEL